MKNTIFWSGILGVIIFVVASMVGGFQIEGYNPISQYISESYAKGIPNAQYFQYAFVVSGLLLAIFAFLAPSGLPNAKMIKGIFYTIAIFYGLGTMVTGIFPCDVGCVPDPNDPTLSQFIHNATGAMTYMIVPFCLIGLGIAFMKWPQTKKLAFYSLLCGIVSLVFVLLLFQDPSGPFIGVYQRVVETSILFWTTYCSFYIIKQNTIFE